MDSDDFPAEQVNLAIGRNAAALMEALEQPEVRRAVLDWTEASVALVGAFRGADIERAAIAGWLTSGAAELVMDALSDD